MENRFSGPECRGGGSYADGVTAINLKVANWVGGALAYVCLFFYTVFGFVWGKILQHSFYIRRKIWHESG